jgi:hypothetical protein
MIPEKIRRKKQTLGVLKRAIALKARREGQILGSLAMHTDIDHKVLWRMRVSDTEQGNDAPEHWTEQPEQQKKVPWTFYIQ